LRDYPIRHKQELTQDFFYISSLNIHMKMNLPYLKQFVIVLICHSFFVTSVIAQKNGILPLTGMKFFNEGITPRSIQVKIDGTQLMSNRIPLNKEIEISLQQPAGFTLNSKQTMYAAAEVVLLSPRGEILLNNPDALLRNYPNGFTAKDLNAFSIKFGIGTDLMKGNMNGLLKIRLYDLKGKGQLRLEFPVTFARAGEPLQTSKTAKTIKSADGMKGMINGLSAKDMLVKVDSTIKVSPKMDYTSVNISKIEGSSMAEMFDGKETFWVYDSDLNEVKITDKLLKQVKGALENDNVDYTLKIPYRLKTNRYKSYFVRYRWESPDRKQLIDLVVVN
jgi:hypothetical protein